MTIQEAAEDLGRRLQGESWLTGVAVADHQVSPEIIIYINSVKNANIGFLNNGWQGFPVKVMQMGRLRPLKKPLVG
jgi:hypothetical protein